MAANPHPQPTPVTRNASDEIHVHIDEGNARDQGFLQFWWSVSWSRSSTPGSSAAADLATI
jgi:hypothetical protein